MRAGQGVRQYLQSIEQLNTQGLGVWQIVELVIFSYLDFAYKNPDLYHLVFERPVTQFVPSEESMAESLKLLVSFDPVLLEALKSGEIKTDLPLATVRDIFIVVLHGLTSMHLANEPTLPPGQGRFGSLIPAVTQVLKAAWQATPSNQ